MLKDKKILLGVTGGIAAYKAIEIASRLKKEGAVVRTILTKHAQEFVGPINFAAITGNKVLTHEFQLDEPIAHVDWAGWADLIVIAPATGNIIAKTAQGIADDLLSSTILASPRPILFAPAMNIYMYANPATQANLKLLAERGNYIIEPDKGMLACGYEGKGRLPAPIEIVHAIRAITASNQDMKGKKVLITAGASQEDIDPMRFITNHSSGKMGLSLARTAYWRGAEVTFIHSRMNETIPEYLNPIKAVTAEEMHYEVMKHYASQNIVIMTAAVADYTPKNKAENKIKKSDDMNLKLERTVDILANMDRDKLIGQYLIGFAAESENVIENAKIKLDRKNLDWVVANDIRVSGSNETSVIMLSKNSEHKFEGLKSDCADFILDVIGSN